MKAQDLTIFQVSGLILSQSNDSSISYVKVRVNHTRNGVLSNASGFYSIPVRMNDTLYFSRLGYHQNKLIVKDYINQYQGNSQYIYVINYMLEDTFTLPMVMIFPYNTPEELRTAVVNMDIVKNTPERIAQSNLDPKELDAIAKTLAVDGGERALVAQRMYQDYYLNRNVAQTFGLNPIAVMQFLKYVSDRAKERRDKNLNYWE